MTTATSRRPPRMLLGTMLLVACAEPEPLSPLQGQHLSLSADVYPGVLEVSWPDGGAMVHGPEIAIGRATLDDAELDMLAALFTEPLRAVYDADRAVNELPLDERPPLPSCTDAPAEGDVACQAMDLLAEAVYVNYVDGSHWYDLYLDRATYLSPPTSKMLVALDELYRRVAGAE